MQQKRGPGINAEVIEELLPLLRKKIKSLTNSSALKESLSGLIEELEYLKKSHPKRSFCLVLLEWGPKIVIQYKSLRVDVNLKNKLLLVRNKLWVGLKRKYN